MRKSLFALAAVLAVAPLAAVAPASAAVQHPAAAQVPCSGNPEVEVFNEQSPGSSTIGYWHVSTSGEASGSSGEIRDASSSSNADYFCEIPLSGGDVELRQEGTSRCATWDQSSPPDNTVQMDGCNPGSIDAQHWFNQEVTGLLWAKGTPSGQALEGDGQDTPVYMNSQIYGNGMYWALWQV